MNSSKGNFLPPERINEKLQEFSCRLKGKFPHLLPGSELRRRVQAQRQSERPRLFFLIAGLCSCKGEQVEINVSYRKHQVRTTRADWGSSDECFEVRKWPHWDMTPHWKQWKPGPSILHFPFHISIQKYISILISPVKEYKLKCFQVTILLNIKTVSFFFSRFSISSIVCTTLFLYFFFIVWKIWPFWFKFPQLNCALKFLSWCLSLRRHVSGLDWVG